MLCVGLDICSIYDHFPGIGRYVINLAHAVADLTPHSTLVLLLNLALPNTCYDPALLASRKRSGCFLPLTSASHVPYDSSPPMDDKKLSVLASSHVDWDATPHLVFVRWSARGSLASPTENQHSQNCPKPPSSDLPIGSVQTTTSTSWETP